MISHDHGQSNNTTTLFNALLKHTRKAARCSSAEKNILYFLKTRRNSLELLPCLISEWLMFANFRYEICKIQLINWTFKGTMAIAVQVVA